MVDGLAIDGGTPVRRQPLPSALEPAGRRVGAEEEEAALRVLRSGRLSSV